MWSHGSVHLPPLECPKLDIVLMAGAPSLLRLLLCSFRPRRGTKTRLQAKGIIMKLMERKRSLTGTKQAPLRSKFSVGCGLPAAEAVVHDPAEMLRRIHSSEHRH